MRSKALYGRFLASLRLAHLVRALTLCPTFASVIEPPALTSHYQVMENFVIAVKFYRQHPAEADLGVACLGIMDKAGPAEGDVTLEALKCIVEGCASMSKNSDWWEEGRAGTVVEELREADLQAEP